jgi:hypothetical protein
MKEKEQNVSIDISVKRKIGWSQLPWLVRFTTIVVLTYMCIMVIAFFVGFVLGFSGY